jgi:hypothetical protein
MAIQSTDLHGADASLSRARWLSVSLTDMCFIINNACTSWLKLSAAGAKAIATSEKRSGKPEPDAPAQESLDSMVSSEIACHTADGGKATPRQGSKLASVMALLSRAEGATIDVLPKRRVGYRTRHAPRSPACASEDILWSSTVVLKALRSIGFPIRKRAKRRLPFPKRQRKTSPFGVNVSQRRKRPRDANVRETQKPSTATASGDAAAGCSALS